MNCVTRTTAITSVAKTAGALSASMPSPDNVDVLDRAYVTSGGDLYCTRCGRKYDRAEYDAEQDEV